MSIRCFKVWGLCATRMCRSSRKAATGARRPECHSLEVLAVSPRARNGAARWEGVRRDEGQGHFLQKEPSTEGALPVDGAGDPGATSGCRSVCLERIHIPVFGSPGGARWFSFLAPASRDGSEEPQHAHIYINNFIRKPVRCT